MWLKPRSTAIYLDRQLKQTACPEAIGGNISPRELKLIYKLPFTKVNGLRKYNENRGFNPIQKCFCVLIKCLIQ